MNKCTSTLISAFEVSAFSAVPDFRVNVLMKKIPSFEST